MSFFNFKDKIYIRRGECTQKKRSKAEMTQPSLLISESAATQFGC